MASERTYWHGMRQILVTRFGEELGTWLAKRVGSKIRGLPLECMDNWRMADAADEVEVKRYHDLRSTGCCGSVDLSFTHYKSGKTLLVGFNYGH